MQDAEKGRISYLGLATTYESNGSLFEGLTNLERTLRNKMQELHEPEDVVGDEHSEPGHSEYNEVVPEGLSFADVTLIYMSEHE